MPLQLKRRWKMYFWKIIFSFNLPILQEVVWGEPWLLPLVLVHRWRIVVLAEDKEGYSGARERISSYFWIKDLHTPMWTRNLLGARQLPWRGYWPDCDRYLPRLQVWWIKYNLDGPCFLISASLLSGCCAIEPKTVATGLGAEVGVSGAGWRQWK